ncbi:MAG: iron(III) transport system substrate-binding protein [Candidatus Latescibacterota bacterium]
MIRLFLTFMVTLCALPVWAQDELVLLSPHWEGVRKEFTDAFQKDYQVKTGREVYLKWLDVGGASDILKYIRSEYKNKPEGIGVDLFFGGGTDPYIELKRQGLLRPYRVPEEILKELQTDLNGVPLYDLDYTWYAATMAGFGIVYNKVVLARLGLPEPHTWEDLAHPQVFSWVGSADPRKSGSVHMAYEIILQAYGWERGWQIVTAMGANVRGFASNAAQTPKDVALGEVAYGLAIDSYAWAQVREAGEDMIGFVMPEGLTLVNGDAIGLLKGAPNQQIAEHFVNFVLSETGQKLWLLRQGEPDGPQAFELSKFSVLPALYDKVGDRSAVKLNPFVWHSDFKYDAPTGSARWGVVNDLMGTQIIDVHEQLQKKWHTMIKDGGVDQIGDMPVDEEGAQALILNWRDPAIRNQTLQDWSAFARDKYGATGIRFLQNIPIVIVLVSGVYMFVFARRKKRS